MGVGFIVFLRLFSVANNFAGIICLEIFIRVTLLRSPMFLILVENYVEFFICHALQAIPSGYRSRTTKKFEGNVIRIATSIKNTRGCCFLEDARLPAEVETNFNEIKRKFQLAAC